MTLQFSFNFIKPSKMNIKNYKDLIVAIGLKNEAKIDRQELDKTTSTWKSDRPTMKSQIVINKRGATITTGPTGNKKGVERWKFLSDGTKIRWAVMSPNWKSKTTPNRMNSKTGKGRVIIMGKRAMQKRNIKPRPGIKARRWPMVLGKKRRRPFTANMKKIMRLAAKGTFE